jgi:hypothetical protein
MPDNDLAEPRFWFNLQPWIEAHPSGWEYVERHMFYGDGFTAGSPVLGSPVLTVR